MQRHILAATALSATLLGAALLLAGCKDEPEKKAGEAKIYASLAACKTERPAEECETAFREAGEQHERAAPRFYYSGACEERYGEGNCVRRHSDTGDVFFPYMAGFLMGHATGSSTTTIVQPIYVDRDRRTYSSGSSGSSAASATWVRPPSATVSAARSSGPTPSNSPAIVGGVSARGGFGSTASTAAVSAGG